MFGKVIRDPYTLGHWAATPSCGYAMPRQAFCCGENITTRPSDYRFGHYQSHPPVKPARRRPPHMYAQFRVSRQNRPLR